MNSDFRRMTSMSESRRLKRKRRGHTKYLDKKERKLASHMLIMNFLLSTGGAGPSMFQTLMMHEQEPFILSTAEREHYPVDVENYPYNTGIHFLGVDNFLSAAIDFCHDVAREGRLPIISVGSGRGSIEEKISEAYRERHGKHSSNLDIILVDPDPTFQDKVHYKYVEDLIEERPSLVGHCAVFIFWPEPQGEKNMNAYDLEAVRSLQPHGVLTVYERNGVSGSEDFVEFLSDDFMLPWSMMGQWNRDGEMMKIDEECSSFGLDHYEVHEIAQRPVYVDQFSGTKVYRMVVARRVDSNFLNACPAINWTCKRQNLKYRKFVAEITGSSFESMKPEERDGYKMIFNMKSLGLV